MEKNCGKVKVGYIIVSMHGKVIVKRLLQEMQGRIQTIQVNALLKSEKDTTKNVRELKQFTVAWSLMKATSFNNEE